ncbi:flagellar assembly protein FliW [Ammoniphilus sp. YIM 78166]|uniref:flagellar assembly protein FliW n=1 Tax=Ammoniphilus sp. YIM 78166 TaxID=1644106 RepID=UPI00106FFAFA|nr:flagellar assembly protein FliW [Ammoniphilus sp. YIM 78166]
MVIQTPIFGEVEISEEKIIQFDKGIPGFNELKRFTFIDLPDTPFQIMQSVTNELYFFVINPFEFYKEYEVVLPDPTIEYLEIKKPEEVALYNIVSLKDQVADSTTNLQAPLVVNVQARKGKQLVLNQPSYSLRQPLFAPLAVATGTD